MLCYYGDDIEQYRRWEDNTYGIMMDLINRYRCDELTQDRDHWRALVNVKLNLRLN